jgi:hypothetical protein
MIQNTLNPIRFSGQKKLYQKHTSRQSVPLGISAPPLPCQVIRELIATYAKNLKQGSLVHRIRIVPGAKETRFRLTLPPEWSKSLRRTTESSVVSLIRQALKSLSSSGESK